MGWKTKHLMLIALTVLAVLFIFFLSKVEMPAPDAELTAEEKAMVGDPNAAVCRLREVNVDSLGLGEILYGKITVEGINFNAAAPVEDYTELALINSKTKQSARWWGADTAGSVHKINGKLYELSVIGDRKLFVAKPYLGEMGIIRVGVGGRNFKKAEFYGSLKSENSAAAVGELGDLWTEPTSEFSVPVGDYYPYLMRVTYDNMRIMISNNYHDDLEGKSMGDRERVYGIKIRKDKPYVFDLSNKPAIVFDQPKENASRFRRGEEIKFAAVLIDPELDIMIRGLDDTSVKVMKEYTNSDGSKRSFETDKSLDPTVVITRADGEVVAEGVMPFG
ncbi:MAG: hypothetical protein ACYTEE_02460 [Planctomycetota bacterium]|jgi:hypothetical protein